MTLNAPTPTPDANTDPATPTPQIPAGTGGTAPAGDPKATPPTPQDAAAAGGDLILGKFTDEAALDVAIAELAKHPKVNMGWIAEAKTGALDDKTYLYGLMQTQLSKAGGSVADADPNAEATPEGSEPSEQNVDLQISDEPQSASMANLMEGVGLSQEDMGKQFLEHGKLTDEQYKAFDGAKITLANGQEMSLGKDLIDEVLTSQRNEAMAMQQAAGALKEQAAKQAVKMVGSQEQLTNLLAWARVLPDATRDDINTRLNDPSRFEGALMELQQRKAQATGATGSGQTINNGMPASEAGTFASTAEGLTALTAAQGNPVQAQAIREKIARTLRAGKV